MKKSRIWNDNHSVNKQQKGLRVMMGNNIVCNFAFTLWYEILRTAKFEIHP